MMPSTKRNFKEFVSGVTRGVSFQKTEEMQMLQLKTKRTGLAVAIGVSLSLGLAACGGGGGGADDNSAPAANAEEIRTAVSLNELGWKFIQDDDLSEAAALSNDGSTWSTVRLPHTWNEKDAASTAQTTPTSKSYKRGRGWYRLEFDNTDNGATQWLQFDGASIVADVWLNGEKLGQHKGAFTEFRFDVTGKLRAGRNVLLVRADNSAAVTASDVTAIAPLEGDFNMSGGLYRGVSLISTPNTAHIALNEAVASLDAAGNDIVQFVAGRGAYARTVSVTNGTATVSVKARLKNDSKSDGLFTVQAALLDRGGETVQLAQKNGVEIKAGASAEVDQELTVANAHLWHGMADPYLYKLVVELRDADGNPIDKVVQDFGIRTMAFDPDKGFYLNGKSVPLRGVNMHQDFQDKAWAISREDTDLSLNMIREMGANTIRLAHYPHASYTYQQSDEMGFVIWAELPFVGASIPSEDCKQTSTVPVSFSANVKLQLQELIRQQYNRASIGMWSINNEAAQHSFCLGVDTMTPLLKELDALANAEDPGRVTTLADNGEKSPNYDTSTLIEHWPTLNTGGITDIWSLNRYFGWYNYNTASLLAANIAELRERYPSLPIGVSEYGAGAALTHHTDNTFASSVCFKDFTGNREVCHQPEEYASRIHEEDYKIIDQPYIWGTYLWTMFDFGSGTRHEGDVGGVNTKGLVTFDRRTRKDAFYFYKANWSKEPVTYITSRRYTERAYAVTDVKVYSNADSVTLELNGAAVGTRSAAECVKKVCEFKNVRLTSGVNNLVAKGSHGGSTVTDSVDWNLSADNAANVYLAAGQMTTGIMSSSGKRYGSDNFFIGGTGYSKMEPIISYVMDGIQPDFTPVSAGASGTPPDDLVLLYGGYRAGAAPFSYDIPLVNGAYTVTLGFIEPDKTTVPGGRVFDVDANGQNVISSLDVLSAAGGYRTAITRSFSVTVDNGRLNLDFRPLVGGAVVSNITVIKQ
jgi:beta-galactosidase